MLIGDSGMAVCCMPTDGVYEEFNLGVNAATAGNTFAMSLGFRTCIWSSCLVSGAAKVDFSPESCILLRKHETLHNCSLVPIDH